MRREYKITGECIWLRNHPTVTLSLIVEIRKQVNLIK